MDIVDVEIEAGAVNENTVSAAEIEIENEKGIAIMLTLILEKGLEVVKEENERENTESAVAKTGGLLKIFPTRIIQFRLTYSFFVSNNKSANLI